MCYQFVLYTGCGHDRSLLYFRARSHTTECLCRSFSRLPLRDTLCPECDRDVKITRGTPVPQDNLTQENRTKCQAWRAFLDNEVKDAENRKLIREAKEAGKDPSTVSIGREVHVAARHLKYADAHKQKHQARIKNGQNPTGFAPPYVPQPAETFLDHIICEIIDDAKSGGEMGRLEAALQTGLQGYGFIDSDGGESWLKLSEDWMKGDGKDMDIMTGSLGPGFLSATNFPVLPPPPGAANASRNIISGNEIPSTHAEEAPRNGNRPTWVADPKQKAASAPFKLRYDPAKTFVPSFPLPKITISEAIETATTVEPKPASTTGLLTELPPLAILPLLFEKYEEDGEEVITDGSGTGSSLATTPAAIEEKEDLYSSFTDTISGLKSPVSMSLSRSRSQTHSHSPVTTIPSKVPTPAPEGPFLQVPQPLPKKIIVPFKTQNAPLAPNNLIHTAPFGHGSPITARHFNPPPAQFKPPKPVNMKYTQPAPDQDRTFPPPQAKLRSQDHIHNKNHFRHHQKKLNNYRGNNFRKFDNQHYRNQQPRVLGPHFAGQNPLLPGPMPFAPPLPANPRGHLPIAVSHAAGTVLGSLNSTFVSKTAKV
ncbi:hypothetical protein TWF718_005285 [Orbilia javanica]|uniref:Uncharacterized protein n=1 Tax=Orbilia javanica TaxID=47235 RepID=A0AAN8MU01_9PEZI